MPIVTYPDEAADMLTFAGRTAPREEEQDGHNPSLWETLGASFRSSNTVGSAAANKLHGIDITAREPGFTSDVVWAEIKDDPRYASHWNRFAHVFNRRAFGALKSQIDMEMEDDRTVDASGWTGFLASTAASIVDLPSLVPGGGVVSGVRLGAAVGRTALRVGALGAVSEAGAEVALQSSQQTRTAAESAMGIGSGAIFGAVLGGAAGALLSAAERKVAFAAIEGARVDRSDEAITEFGAGAREGASVGAAAVSDTATLGDFAIAGGGAKAIGKATAGLNPVLRAAHSPSLAHRSAMADLQETGFYVERNARGEGNLAVETAVKYWERGALGTAITKHRDFYTEARKAGMDMSQTEFREAVGKAMRRNDAGDNEWVTKAAQAWRGTLFDPLKVEAINARIFKEDVSVDTAPSYLSRVYKTKLIEAEEVQFKGLTKQWLRGQIDTIEEMAERGALKEGKPHIPQFVSEADKQSYIDDIANEVFDKLTGRSGAGQPAYSIVSEKRGPMKERTFTIPDAMIERYLESDVELIGRRYARVMGSDVELARKFGKSTLEDQIKGVRQDYQRLRDEARAKGADEKAINKLKAREERDVTDLGAVRDILRGQYKVQDQHTNFARLATAVQTFNYLRAMGGVVFANLTETVRPAMVHGMGRFMAEGIVPLVTNLRAIKMSARDAKLIGTITDRVLMSRMASMAELADPYAMQSPFERFMENTAVLFTKATLLPFLNDFNRTVSSVLTQNRILKNTLFSFDTLKQKEKAYMGFLGIDADMADRIGRMFKEFGQVDGNVHVPNFERWTDEGARRAFAGALNKDVDGTIIMKGAGDVPLAMSHPGFWRMATQFKSFAIASNQRVLMRGVQEGPATMMTGMVAMSTIGMMVYAAKQMEAGRDITDNPGTLIAEGLDRTGIFSIAFEINNAVEKVGGAGVYSLAAKPFAQGQSADKASRFAARNAVDSFMGPTFGGAKDVATLAGAFAPATKGEDINLGAGDWGAIRRLSLGGSLPYWRWFLDGIVMPEVQNRTPTP